MNSACKIGWTGLAAQGARVFCGLSSIFHGQHTAAEKSSPAVTSHPWIAFPRLVPGCLLCSLPALKVATEPSLLQHPQMSRMNIFKSFSGDGENSFTITLSSKPKEFFFRRPCKKKKISQCIFSGTV